MALVNVGRVDGGRRMGHIGWRVMGIGGDRAVRIGGDRAMGIGGDWAVGVGGDRTVGIGGHWTMVDIGSGRMMGVCGNGSMCIGGDRAVGIGGDRSMSVSDRSMGHRLDDGRTQGSLADDRIEAVHGIGGVVNGAPGAVWLDQRVLASDHVSVARLVLVLVVAGHRILDVILERVLGMGVVFGGL